MEPSAPDVYKIDEAAKILNCSIEDILDQWSAGNIFLCVYFSPPEHVIKIEIDLDDCPENYDHSVNDKPELDEIYGSYYIHYTKYNRTSTDKKNAKDIVLQQRNMGSDFINNSSEHGYNISLNGRPIISPEVIDDSLEKGTQSLSTTKSFYYLRNKTSRVFNLNLNKLRITRKELGRFQKKGNMIDHSILPKKDLQKTERENLLLTIGVLALRIANDHKNRLKKGGMPNINQISTHVLDLVGKDIYGISKSSLNERISKGLKLYDKVKGK